MEEVVEAEILGDGGIASPCCRLERTARWTPASRSSPAGGPSFDFHDFDDRRLKIFFSFLFVAVSERFCIERFFFPWKVRIVVGKLIVVDKFVNLFSRYTFFHI